MRFSILHEGWDEVGIKDPGVDDPEIDYPEVRLLTGMQRRLHEPSQGALSPYGLVE